MNNINTKVLIEKTIQEIKESQEYIEKANEIDRKHYKLKIKIEKLISIANKMKSTLIEPTLINLTSEQEKYIFHNGNPYITFILAMKALISNVNLIIYIPEVMLGVNLSLIQIINKVQKEMRMENKIELKMQQDMEKISKDKEIIVLGDRMQYSGLLKMGKTNTYYLPKYNIALYSDGEELEEVKHKMFEYCVENFIEIEIYEAENVEEALEQMIEDNEGETILILTKEKIDLKEIEHLKNKNKIEIYINENILNNFEERLIY